METRQMNCISKESTPRDEAKAAFIAWFEENYPPNCILSRPSWHAPKIFNAAEHAMKAMRSEIAPSMSQFASKADYEAAVAPDAWRSVALRLGEQLAPTGPDWYYAMTPTQWLDWCQSALPSASAPLTQALRFVDAIESLAFEMSPPNQYTPRIVQLCNTLRHIIRTTDSGSAKP